MLTEFLLTDTSPSSPSTVASTTAIAKGLIPFDWFTIDAIITGATGGTLDVYLQRYCQQLAEWRDWVHFTQAAAGAAAARYSLDSRMSEVAITVVGAGTTPALAAGKIVCQRPTDQVRMLFVAGASTTLGAVQKVVLSGWRRRA